MAAAQQRGDTMNDDEDSPTADSCFTCGFSPTRSEARGYRQAITDLPQRRRLPREPREGAHPMTGVLGLAVVALLIWAYLKDQY